MKDFNLEDLEFYLPDSFKGLLKSYILQKIFDEEIQKNWKPKEGDLIVGCTGNIFAISGHHTLVKELGGDLFFFGGGLCTRDGGCILNDTYSYTMNEDGLWYSYGVSGVEKTANNCYHSSFKDFRYLPYPHEL